MNIDRIYVWGPNQFNNRLFAGQIEDITSVMPVCICEDDDLSGYMLDSDCLVFCDCDKRDARAYCSRLARSNGLRGNSPAVVLMNVKGSGLNLVNEVRQYCIQGIFYMEDELDIFSKGLNMVLQGEHWIPRDVLVMALQDAREGDTGKYVFQENLLTKREIEIVRLIVSGFSNQDIANKLYISTNTVKTHVSNLYKKINVKNRVQAILWASENLSPLGHVESVTELASLQV